MTGLPKGWPSPHRSQSGTCVIVSGMSIDLQGLRTVIYPVSDLGAAKAWWTAVLGQDPYFDEPFYVGYNVGGYELGLLPDVSPGHGALVYWGVVSVPDAMAAAADAGAVEHIAATDVGDGIVTGSVLNPNGSIVGFIMNPHFMVGS